MQEPSKLKELEEWYKKDIVRLSELWPEHKQEALIQIVRVMDYLFVRTMYGDNEAIDQLKHYALGWEIAIDSLLIDNRQFRVVPLMTNSKTLFQWANSILHYCGKMGLVKLTIDQIKTGLAQISKVIDNIYYVEYFTKYVGAELIERENFLWYNEYSTESTQHFYDSLRYVAKDIHTQMKARTIWKFDV